MEHIKKNTLIIHFNPVFFTLCFGSPVFAFIVSLFIINALTAAGGGLPYKPVSQRVFGVLRPLHGK